MISAKQRKILTIIDKNARLHNSKIGKLTSMAKSVVTYNINTLLNKKIIKGFATLIDHSSLGYFELRCYINLYENDVDKENNFIEFLKHMKDTGVVIRSIGDFDLAVSFYVSNIETFWKHWFHTLGSFRSVIKNYTFNIIVNKQFYPFFKKDEEDPFFIIGNKNVKKVDESDLKILDYLNEDCRKPIHEIANALEISSSSVIYRIKKLEKQEVILGYYTIFNFSKLEKGFSRLQVQLEEVADIDEFLHFLKSVPSLVSVAKVIGSGNDLEIDFLVDNVEELNRRIKSIKEKFPSYIRDYSYIRFIETIKWNHKPFLVQP